MSTRLLNLLVLALFVGAAAGCASEGIGAQDAGGFLQGVADGFLILVQFAGGHLGEADRLSSLSMNTAYGLGYLAGATSFLGVGTAISAP